MAKVPKVLGEGAPKFRDTHIHPHNGQRYAIYRFPKRGACLVAMSGALFQAKRPMTDRGRFQFKPHAPAVQTVGDE